VATVPKPYTGGALPTNVVRVSNTTLFHVAAAELGNAMYWTAIAALNDLVDPWVIGLTELKIPIFFDKSDISGVLGT
jgi:hypothetical protein